MTSTDARTPEPTELPALLQEAGQRLTRTVDGLRGEDWAAPSRLPGWSRAHVVAHLTLNAEGLAGALEGVARREPVPMYASQEARNADIERLAGSTSEDLRERFLASTTAYADALAAVPPERSDERIERTPGGPTFRAAAVPGMRLREVEIHHADLGCGYSHRDWPLPFALLVLDSMARREAAAEAFTVRPAEISRSWTFGEPGAGTAAVPVVSGPAADLAWWLTGRGAGEGLTCDGGPLPTIGAW